MGGSTASAWPGSWLIVALVVIICLARSSRPADGRMLEFLKSSDLNHEAVMKRNNGEWIKRCNECIKQSDKIDTNANIEVGNAIHWLKLQGSVSEKITCAVTLENNLLKWKNLKNKSFSKCQKLLNEYFVFYVNKCGFEESYKQLIENLESIPHKDWDLKEHKTIYSYLKSKSQESEDVGSVLKAIKEASKEIDCAKSGLARLLRWVNASRYSNDGRSFELAGYSFALYLHKCGHERHFKKARDNLIQVSDEPEKLAGHKTLYEVLVATNLDEGEVTAVLSVFKEMSEFDSISEDMDCTKMDVKNMIKSVGETIHFSNLHPFVGNYFRFYLKRCGYEGHFEKATNKLSRVSGKLWDSATYKTLFSYLLKGTLRPFEVISLLSALKDYSEYDSESKGIDCGPEHETKLLRLYVDSCDFEYLHEFVADYYALFLRECHFESYFRIAVDNREPFSNRKWNSVKYPTLYSLIKTECRSLGRVKWHMSVIKKISELGSISQESDCTDELQTSLLDLVDESAGMEKLRGLANDYFGHYLSECGFERRFEKAKNNIMRSKLTHESFVTDYRTLGEYFRLEPYLTTTDKLTVFEIVEDISLFDEFSKETHCSEERMKNLIYWNFMQEGDIGFLLGEVMRNYLILNLKECGLKQSLMGIKKDRKMLRSDQLKADRAKSIAEELFKTDGSPTKNELPEQVM